MKDWRITTVGDNAEINQTSIRRDYPYERIVYLDTGSVTRGEISEIQELSLEDAPSRAKRLVKDKDIVYSTVRPIQRHFGYLRNPPDNLVVSTGFAVISAIPDRADPKYLYYVLTSDAIVNYFDVIASSSTSAYPSLTPDVIANLQIELPRIEEQKAIAKILSAFDDKIELNRRMNATLEEMARALFKAWFVDFEPVHANREGRPSTSASPEIAKLFPSDFENNIPKGWQLSVIGEEVQVVGGSTPSTKEPAFWNGKHNWVTPKDLSNLQDKILIRSERSITPAGLAMISSGELPVNTVLLSSRAPVGYLAITKIPVSINQGFIAMKCNKKLSPAFVLQWAEHSMDKIKNRASGTTFAEISKANFRPLPVLVPANRVLIKYEEIAGTIYEKIAVNARENETLSKLRDELLPRLIGGKLRVEF